MTDFLVSAFVKKKPADAKTERARYGRLAGIVGIVCNVILFALKLTIGVVIGSVSVMADSFNNLSDSGSSIVTMIGFKAGSKPPDAEHPFGHGRMEYVSGLIVAIFIVLVGFEFLKSSVEKILSPEALESVGTAAIAVLLVTMAVKLWLAAFNKKIGKEIGSKALEATARDALNDVLVTGVTVVSILVYKYTGLMLDGFAGLAVALVLVKSGWDIAKDTLSTLLGECVGGDEAREIRSLILRHPSVCGAHDLVLHNYGPNYSMGTVHAEVSASMSLEQAHEIADSLERELNESLGVFMVVHIDPVALDDERLTRMSELVTRELSTMDSCMSAHDFRIINASTGRTNLVFDVVVPHGMKEKQRNEMTSKLQDAVTAFEPGYQCIINLESGFEAVTE